MILPMLAYESAVSVKANQIRKKQYRKLLKIIKIKTSGVEPIKIFKNHHFENKIIIFHSLFSLTAMLPFTIKRTICRKNLFESTKMHECLFLD